MQVSEYFEQLKRGRVRIVVDDAAVGELVRKSGLDVVHYDDHDFLARSGQASFVMLTKMAYHARFGELWERAADILSHISLAKFDSSLPCVDYSLSRFLSIDYDATLSRRAAYYDKLLSCERVEAKTEAGHLTCRFGEEVEMADDSTSMEPGFLYSTAEFFEASIVTTDKDGDSASFHVDGDFSFDGMVFLSNTPAIKDAYGAVVDSLIRRAARGGNALRWVDNHIERLSVGGEDVTELFVGMMRGGEREDMAIEFSIGCVEYAETPDWSRNSVLNEGTHGLHVGVGMGLERPHIDFISTRAEMTFPGEVETDFI